MEEQENHAETSNPQNQHAGSGPDGQPGWADHTNLDSPWLTIHLSEGASTPHLLSRLWGSCTVSSKTQSGCPNKESRKSLLAPKQHPIPELWQQVPSTFLRAWQACHCGACKGKTPTQHMRASHPELRFNSGDHDNKLRAPISCQRPDKFHCEGSLSELCQGVTGQVSVMKN